MSDLNTKATIRSVCLCILQGRSSAFNTTNYVLQKKNVIYLFHLLVKHVEVIWQHSLHLLIIRPIICTSLGRTAPTGAFPKALSEYSECLLWRLLNSSPAKTISKEAHCATVKLQRVSFCWAFCAVFVVCGCLKEGFSSAPVCFSHLFPASALALFQKQPSSSRCFCLIKPAHCALLCWTSIVPATRLQLDYSGFLKGHFHISKLTTLTNMVR